MRRRVSSGSPLEPQIGFSRAVRVGCQVGTYLVDRADVDAVAVVHGRAFGDARPATGFILVAGFIDPRRRVEIEADAIVS